VQNLVFDSNTVHSAQVPKIGDAGAPLLKLAAWLTLYTNHASFSRIVTPNLVAL